MAVGNYNQCVLYESLRDRLDVVLVSPRNPLNIGAAARAMANFGFQRLSVVAPYAPTWREARSAVGAPELLQNAQEFSTIAEAVAECMLVLGTGSLTYRKPEQPVVQLPALAPRVAEELARGGRIALVFGPEKHGLTRDDLSYCHILVEIPTDSRQPSMNLGQAVAVCLYELAMRVGSHIFCQERAMEGTSTKGQEADFAAPLQGAEANLAAFPGQRFACPGLLSHRSGANRSETSAAQSGFSEASGSSGSLELLAGVIEEAMRASDYSPRGMQSANRHDLRLLLRRLALSAHDARRILGLFRRILWRLNRVSAPKIGPG
jgi:tRNA/rRNA methyltransferase